MSIKALPSFYKGQEFRSRLEARWAIFFDLVGLEYYYEPEGYDLGELGWYLPDFFLPTLHQNGTWVEVKPTTNIWEDRTKWEHLSITTDIPFIVCRGMPGENKWVDYLYWDKERDDVYYWFNATFVKKYLPPQNHDGCSRLWYDEYQNCKYYFDYDIESEVACKTTFHSGHARLPKWY